MCRYLRLDSFLFYFEAILVFLKNDWFSLDFLLEIFTLWIVKTRYGVGGRVMEWFDIRTL